MLTKHHLNMRGLQADSSTSMAILFAGEEFSTKWRRMRDNMMMPEKFSGRQAHACLCGLLHSAPQADLTKTFSRIWKRSICAGVYRKMEERCGIVRIQRCTMWAEERFTKAIPEKHTLTSGTTCLCCIRTCPQKNLTAFFHSGFYL